MAVHRTCGNDIAALAAKFRKTAQELKAIRARSIDAPRNKPACKETWGSQIKEQRLASGLFQFNAVELRYSRVTIGTL